MMRVLNAFSANFLAVCDALAQGRPCATIFTATFLSLLFFELDKRQNYIKNHFQ